MVGSPTVIADRVPANAVRGVAESASHAAEQSHHPMVCKEFSHGVLLQVFIQPLHPRPEG